MAFSVGPYLVNFVDPSGIEQDALCESSFSRVDVSRNSDVSHGLLYGYAHAAHQSLVARCLVLTLGAMLMKKIKKRVINNPRWIDEGRESSSQIR
jgi:hypothetical protein